MVYLKTLKCFEVADLQLFLCKQILEIYEASISNSIDAVLIEI